MRWERVESLAQHHGLLGLAHRSITGHGIPVPAEFAARLSAAAMATAAGNLAKFVRWKALVQRFDTLGVKVLTLKGFHVAAEIYGDLAIRPVGDLDFLVRSDDVARSVSALGAVGYHVGRRWSAAIANVGLEHALPRTYEMQLGASDGLAIDLHWRAGPAHQALPTAELLAGAQRFTVQDAIGWGASRPDLLALLVAHGHKSRWHRFRWVVDVAEGFALLDADEHVRMRQHLERLKLLPALAVVERLIAGSWDDPASRNAAAQSGDVAHDALRHIAAIHERIHDVHQTHDAWRPWRLLRERVAEHRTVLGAARAAATPSHQDWAAIALPRGLRFGYVAVRPLRILADAWRMRRQRGAALPAGHVRSTDDSSATFVTAIYGSGPDSLIGGRGRGLPFYLPTLRNLASFGSPLVVFASQADVAEIERALAPMFPRLEVIPFELLEFEFARDFLPWKAEYRESLPLNDRNELLCFLKIYWLASVSRRRPWGSARTYWIDAGLFHHGIFPERVGGVEQLAQADEGRFFPQNRENIVTPTLRRGIVDATEPGRLFVCAMPSRHAMFSREQCAALTGRTSADPAFATISEHVIGGLFGGFDDDIQRFLQAFRQLLVRAIALRIYTLEEQLFSLLHAMHPEWFATQRFTTWYFYAPGEPCARLDAEADSFYKVFTRLLAQGRAA